MLELYHHGSSVCAAKVRFALAEKGVEVDKAHYIDILAGEQFTDAYRSINPKQRKSFWSKSFRRKLPRRS